MKSVKIDYGDGHMEINLPDSATVVRYKETYDDPPAVDPRAATRKALDNPVGMPPLKELGGPNKKVVIGFPDRVKGGVQETAHRRVALPMIIEDLLAAGTPIENITMMCAVGLHRQNTLEEWNWYLGKDLVDQFYPGRLVNHDAEDPKMVDLGTDAMGNVVHVSHLLADADVPIILGHCAGNPYGGFSGGYKMLVTGHTSAACIANHHAPGTMHREDWLGASTDSMMRKQFRSIGEAIEKGIGKKIFCVDAVLGQKAQQLAVAAGGIAEVEDATWPLAKKRTNIELDMKEKADVLVFGIPRNFHYGPGMGTNPILMNLAVGGQLSRCWHAFKEGGVVIAASICDGWFNDSWFPSYEETYESLVDYNNATEFLASDDAHRIARDVDYLFKYSNQYTYHPFHAMSMTSGGAVPAQRCSEMIMVGAKAPKYARGMGWNTVATFDEAMKQAERYVGKNPRVLCTPEALSGGVGVHLHAKNGG